MQFFDTFDGKWKNIVSAIEEKIENYDINNNFIIDCEHESTAGTVVTIRILNDRVKELRKRSTYQFNVNYEIPNFAKVQLLASDGTELAMRDWLYQDGRPVQSKHFSAEVNARVQIMDNMTCFFNLTLPLGDGDTKAKFQISNGIGWVYTKAVPMYQVGFRGSI